MVVAPAFASGDLVLSKEFTIRDAVDGANFAPTHTVATPGHLSIGFESGTNLQTFTSRAFLATTSGAKTTAAEVLVIRITAPAGFVIGTVSYEQVGTRTLSRQGRVASLLSWVDNGVPRVAAKRADSQCRGQRQPGPKPADEGGSRSSRICPPSCPPAGSAAGPSRSRERR